MFAFGSRTDALGASIDVRFVPKAVIAKHIPTLAANALGIDQAAALRQR